MDAKPDIDILYEILRQKQIDDITNHSSHVLQMLPKILLAGLTVFAQLSIESNAGFSKKRDF